MKKNATRIAGLFFLLCVFSFSYAQNVGINTDGSVPDASAMLDVKSTDKGLLVPRMTTAQRAAISSPATGLLVFDTHTNSFWYYTGSAWNNLASGWSLSGNSATDPATHFIGTTDNAPLMIKVFNQPAGTIHASTGNAGWGYLSFSSNTSGTHNTGLGNNALQFNTMGSGNTATGYFTLRNNITGSENAGFGKLALELNTVGSYNTALGVAALAMNTNGNGNTAIGWKALFTNDSGYGNTAAGFSSLSLNSSGYDNTSMGFYSLYQNTTGIGNTAIGINAMVTNKEGINNTAIGRFADVTMSSLTNATAIGYDARVNASNKVRIGNAAVTVIEGQVPFTSPSDGRYKFAVREDVKGLDFILQLRPVTYQFDVQRFDAHLQQAEGKDFSAQQASYAAARAIRRTGFIAQEVEQAALKAGYTFSGIIKPRTDKEHYSLSYESFVVPLVKAIQEQQKIIDDLQQRLERLEKKAQHPENN